MEIVEIINENVWNIVISIGTGIFSSIFVSKIFLIYQNIKSDFLEIVKHTGAYKGCYIIYQTYKNDKFPEQYGKSIPTNYNNSKEDVYRRIKDASWEELNSLNNIYTKYMDEELCSIIECHKRAICRIYEECDERCQQDERMEKYLSDLKNELLKYGLYQKKLFKRTLLLVFSDKLIVCLLFVFLLFICIA